MVSTKTLTTIRLCNKCGYLKIMMRDNKEDKECRYCSGKLEIIAEGKII